jgi:putative heme-binding domain-containing protein
MLAGLNALIEEDILAGLKDKSAGVRENAMKLAEQSAAGILPAVPFKPPLLDTLVNLANDPDARVRFQLAFTLGEISDPRSLDALATIAKHDAAEPWIRTAVLSSVANTSDQLLERLLVDQQFAASAAAPEIVRELAQVIGARSRTAEMQRSVAALSTAADTPARREVIVGIGEGLKRSGKSLRRAGFSGDAARVVDDRLSHAARIAAEARSPVDVRAAAVRLLAYEDFDRAKPTLAALLDAKQPQDVQRAAISALGSFTAPDTALMLLAHWRTQTPSIRAEVINAMLGGRARVLPLLQVIERGEIPANQIPFAKRATLLRSTDPKVKALATKLFSDSAPGPRQEVIARYQAALSLKGDAARGKQVFVATCAACHRAGDIGRDVGPNLATIRAWNPDQVLINILDPNREVAPNFVSYTVETKDGRTLDGLIAEESAASLTLKRAEGVTDTVLRRDISTLTGSGLSLMPEGIEAAITVGQMADLIAFLLQPN